MPRLLPKFKIKSAVNRDIGLVSNKTKIEWKNWTCKNFPTVSHYYWKQYFI